MKKNAIQHMFWFSILQEYPSNLDTTYFAVLKMKI